MRYFFLVGSFFILLYSTTSAQPNNKKKTIPIGLGEKWYGAAVNEGEMMPFSEGYSINLNGDTKTNQAAPLILSTRGRYIWSNAPFAFLIKNDKIVLSNYTDSILLEKCGSNLKDAYMGASRRFFPATGKLPDSLLFKSPQYNTWIELVYNQNQKDILKYAHDIINNGFPAGVLMIDDNWAPYYGKFEFRKDRFSDAKAMINELKCLGFKVILWVSPFISPDTEESRELLKDKFILMSNEGNINKTWEETKTPALINWWNGYSFVMDFSNPNAVAWYKNQLQKMTVEYGLDGFKFDAGDPEFYPNNTIAYQNISANKHTELWGLFGLEYSINEYRAMWKRGNEPLVERLRDKLHTWSDLKKLIPHITTAALLGYTFSCPDMIGGGNYSSFISGSKLDQDLIVRSAQCQALMPMMQFSVAPWRVLDKEHLEAIKKAVKIRQSFVPQIMRLAQISAKTGEPIVSNMEYSFPNKGFETCKDQFMLGENIMVAPMIEKGFKRTVIFPEGKWKSNKGLFIKGPDAKQFEVSLNDLLWFEKMK
ncbi:MAG: glycoside hydrolase family 31 protein [Bacteroidales bacterium]|nr:glycoside hydrolase family 31 protein [Bacteroidales bacterium]